MPTVRDGRGQLTEYRVEPIGAPSGPIERGQVSQARMADFAAERAAATRPAEAAPIQWRGRGGGRPRTTPEQRQARIDTFLAAVRASGSHIEAGKKLGVSGARVAQFIGELRRAGDLPVDVDNLLRARAGQRPVPESARGNHADIGTLSDIEGQEAGAPVTDAVAVEQPERDGSTVGSTPPGPSDVVSVELTIHVSIAELVTWRPERISAFMAGIAKVTAARWGTE